MYIYTNQGDKRHGQWYRTGESWQKGLCIVEFQRVCNSKGKQHDLQTLSSTNETDELFVQDPDTVSIVSMNALKTFVGLNKY